jgi:hypothetical protein
LSHFHHFKEPDMHKVMILATLCAAATLSGAAFAQAPAAAPTGSTGLCNDGSYYSGATKKGACSGHQGVKTWWGVSAAPAAPAAQSAAPAPSTTPAAAPAATRPAAAAPAAAPGGGPGMVWVNKSSKTYHCSTDRWYGKTKDGAYLSEADAKTQGFHAAHGKACQ